MKIMKKPFLTILSFLITESPIALHAAENRAVTEPLSSSHAIIQMLFGLAIVLALFISMAWLLRRFGQDNFKTNKIFRTIGTMSVGTRERLLLIEVSGEQFVLAVSPGSITKIHHFDQPIAMIEQTTTSDFATKLKAIIERRKES